MVMDGIGWALLAIAAFALVHVLVYLVYVRRSEEGSVSPQSISNPDPGDAHPRRNRERVPDIEPRARDRLPDPTDLEASMTFDGETVSCPVCTATNVADSTITFCWNCISPLE